MEKLYLILVLLNSFCLDTNYTKLQQAPSKLDSLSISKQIIGCYNDPKDWSNAYAAAKTLMNQFSEFSYKLSILDAIIENPIFRHDTTGKEVLKNKISLLLNRAYYNKELSKYATAKIDFELAYDIFKKNDLTNADYDIANYGLRNLANIFTRLGDNQKAQETFETAIALLNKGKTKPDTYASISIDLAISYADERKYAKAIEIYKSALDQNGISTLYIAKITKSLIEVIFEKHIEENNNSITEINPSLVFGLEVEQTLNEIIQIFKDRIVENSGDAYNWLSGTYKLYGDIGIKCNLLSKQEIIDLQHKSLNAFQQYKVENPNAREIAKQYCVIGQTFLHFAEIDSAKRYFYLGLKTILPKYNLKLNPLPNKELFFNENAIYENLEGLAEVFTQQDSLELALLAYELAFYAKLKLRSIYDFESSKLYLQREAKEVNAKAINAAYNLHKNSNNESDIERAFKIAESSRALVLLEGIIQNQQVENTTEDSLFLNTQKAKFDKPVSFSELENNLEENEVLIEYFQTEDSLYAFKIEKHNNPEFYQLQLNSQKLQDLLTALRSQETTAFTFTPLANKIYQEVFEPLSIEAGKKVIIIPDGELNYLSFEALVTKASDKKSFKKQQYLLESNAINYQYSATIFCELIKHINQNEYDKVLSIAPVFEGSKQFLKYSDNEVNEIGRIFPSDFIIKNSSTKENILSKISKYNILHFSTHASGGDQNNQQAHILLYNDSLQLDEIYQQQINANLTVLSACETNIGKYQGGEGVMSLSRAFAYAGCPSLVSTLWKVNEKSTKDIIVGFYKNLKNGNTKDEALKQAKLDYLKNTDDAHPYYWASLVAIGNTKPLLQKQQLFNLKLLWLLFPFGVVGIFFLWRKYDYSAVK